MKRILPYWKLIKSKLQMYHLSIDYLANTMNLDVSVVRKLLKGKLTLTDNLIKHLAIAFNTTENYWYENLKLYQSSLSSVE